MDNPQQLAENEDMQIIPLLALCYRKFIKNWYWFLLSVILCVVAGWFFQQRMPRIYERQSVMLIEEADATGASSGIKRSRRNNMTSLLELNGVSVGDNLKNEIFIISSKRLMLRVAERLRLDIDYLRKENLHQVAMYGDERPFEVLFQEPFTEERAKQLQRSSLSFEVTKRDEGTVLLSGFTDAQGKQTKNLIVRLGQVVKTPVGKLCIVRGMQFAKWKDEVITVTRTPVAYAASIYQNKLNVGEYDKETSLIVLTAHDMNEKRADDVLNTLYAIYKEDVVENKNRVAQSTANFIDERIRIIGTELSSVENELANFKKRNQIVDFKQTSQTVLNETATARQQSLNIETQLNVAQFLNNYLSNSTNDRDLIPTLNLGDGHFNQQIASYNQLMNDRNRMASNTSEEQTVIREMDRQLAQVRQTISASLRNYINSLELQLRDARSNEFSLTSKIASAPEQEKRGIDIQRQQALKESLYTYLLNKREEVALQQAINEANVRLVEGPIGGRRVSPRSSMILLISLCIGLFIPAFIIWLRIKMDVTVHGRKEIEEATTVPLIGEIPHMKNANEETLISSLPSDAPLVEAFRIMRYSLNYLQHDTQVIMLTSTTPGQGKSFLSRNIAITFAMANKRVLVIDGDIRRRSLSHSFDHHLGLTTYLSDPLTKIKDIIKVDGIAPGVDFMGAGNTPPNPSELLLSDRLDQLIDELRHLYDYIVVDSTPMFAVADAAVMNRVADTTFFVMRAKVQTRDFLPELEKMYQNDRFKNLCIVLNDVNEKNKRYGSGYGYGYGYTAKKKQ